MWSCDRRRLLGLLAVVPLAGCGFTPAYAPGSGASASARPLLNAVEVAAPQTRAEYLLTRHLEDRLGRTSNPVFLLDYTLFIDQESIAITANNITRRFNLTGQASYRLTTPTGAVLNEGVVENFTGYSATGTTVATRAARDAAEARLTTILGDAIVTRLIAAAPNLPSAQSPAAPRP